MSDLFSHGYALLIGVNENSVPGWALPGVERDITALGAVFAHSQRCGYVPENIKVLVGKQATRQNIQNALDWLSEKLKADDDATAVLYYSGHGWEDKTTAPAGYYLIPYDVDSKNLRRTALRADDFAQDVSALKPKRLLVLMDCCHAAGMDVKELKESEELAPFAIPPAWFMGGQQAIDLGAKGLEESALLDGSGRAVLNSCRNNESSYILPGEKMSLFTYLVIKALTGHAPHGAQDEAVSTATLLDYVWREVPAKAAEIGKQQHPDGKINGVFSIALLIGGQGLPEGKAPPDPLETLPAPLAAAPQTQVNVGPISNVSGGEINIAGGNIVKTTVKTKVETGGGAYIAGGVNTGGGDFVGRDKVVHGDVVHGDKIGGDKISVGNISGSTGIAIGRGAQSTVNYGMSGVEIERLFKPVMDSVTNAPAKKRQKAQPIAEQLQAEAKKGKAANDELMASLLEGLVDLVPGAISAVVGAFASPILAGIAGPAVKYVLNKLRQFM